VLAPRGGDFDDAPREEPLGYQCQGTNVGPSGTLRKGNGSVTGGVPFTLTDAPLAIRTSQTGGNWSDPVSSNADTLGTDAATSQAIAFHHTQDPISGDVSPCLSRKVDGMDLADGLAVRRLTPRECERLQGFPDDYTAIPGAADGPRYRALGNSMAVVVMAWIGRRIAIADAALRSAA
jgi:hypothetical protein